MKPSKKMRSADAPRLIVQIGPDMSAHGGIASVLSAYALHRDGFEAFGYRLLFISSGAGSGRGALGVFFLAWIKLVILSLSEQVHVVHIHVSIKGSLLRKLVFAITCMLFRKKYVIHVHSGMFPAYCAGLPGFAWRIVRTVLTSAQYVICLSGHAQKQLISMRLTTREKCRLVYNGIAEPIGMETRKTSSSSDIALTFLGKLSEQKGIFRLLEALALLPESSPRYRLFVGGEGEVEALSELSRKYRLDDRVVFGGWVTGEAKTQLLADTEIFVLPSRSEGFPVSIVEAMAFGTAIVSTRIPGVMDAIRPELEGLLVEPDDIGGLRDAISLLLGDAATRRRLGDAARRRFLDQFTIQKTVHSLVSIYDNVT
ncbi:glycosyltransferase family 4 protein [Paraburkholderia megapolitana]|uniref:Glycosyltransferase involved in cell wall bisynthesis n=1 Tax=Paraburkholderia megapolitana TaxID=420953 RepID=A0A1I3DM05_9BURK|nr:glycosyltransferase family 4 protein [Paraburkholderia megapolitana]QDQ81922.1 glycosyltransferase family 4 protein [Paraburkholderia megapolitana]SFH87568.1 Glycosyltransferase involved in cell wall bisynthesis [Paraburkholderia megapolitana]